MHVGSNVISKELSELVVAIIEENRMLPLRGATKLLSLLCTGNQITVRSYMYAKPESRHSSDSHMLNYTAVNQYSLQSLRTPFQSFNPAPPRPAPPAPLGLTSMRSSVVRELRTLLALKLLCSDRGP